MRQLYREAGEVEQSTANRGARVINKYFRIHNVTRASNLPEEAKVELHAELLSLKQTGTEACKRYSFLDKVSDAFRHWNDAV